MRTDDSTTWRPARRLTVYLDDATLADLSALARREDRDARTQAARLIRDGLRREGLAAATAER